MSDKARNYLTDEDIKRILSGIIEGESEDRRKDFRDELFYRYLLTKGDSFGGEMGQLRRGTGGIRFRRRATGYVATAPRSFPGAQGRKRQC